MMRSIICAGERQGLQRSEGPGARTVQNRQDWRNTACKAPHSGLPALRSRAFTGALAAAPAARQLCDAAADPVAGVSWSQS
jgi:hypothetical protein